MANTKQAAKRARKSLKQRSHNVSMRSEIRTAIKKIHTAIGSGDAAAALAAYKAEQATIDSLARKGVIHKNKAARHKSRLAARIKALSGSRA
ncbi:MAG TPA: 30S ribosomal protein S20 [Usitatibacter sp.]|nr:30S ribosomal protein S20 [Usitatibacter sp.]